MFVICKRVQGGPKNGASFKRFSTVLRLVTLEVLIRSAANLVYRELKYHV